MQSLDAYAFTIGDMNVADVDTPAVLRLLEPIWQTKTETANRVRGRIEAVLDWAAVYGYRPRGDNPARWRGHLDQVFPRRSAIAPIVHHPALPYAEAAYERTDLFEKRRKLMDAWAKFASTSPARQRERGSNVVPMGGAR